MRTGYGRGYYGTGQLEPSAPRRGGGLVKFAVVVGVGAAVWYFWPRSKYDLGRGGDEPKSPSPTPLPPSPPEGQFAQLDQGGQLDPHASLQLDQRDSLGQVAEARGYPSQQAYEDAVVESARQLQDAGAKVAFAPHLAHLTPRLGP